MKKSLLKNTIYLYLLTFSNYIFGFVTIPYLTRILGPEVFGVLGFAMAFHAYFCLILDFGFLLSGTKKVAEYADDCIELAKIVSSIIYIKVFLFVILSIILLITCLLNHYLWANCKILFCYLLLAGVSSMMPDFLYRGLEKMEIITIRTLIIRCIFTSLIFVFLKSAAQYCLVPIFQILGTVVALMWVYNDLHKNLKIHIVKVHLKYVLSLFCDSYQYFLSRIASSVYNVTNTVILGFVYSNSNIIGLYTAAEKIKLIVGQVCAPVADSFYPYMLRTKDFSRMIKVTILLELFIIIGCVLMWIYAEYICITLFGQSFVTASSILRYMLPLIAIALPTFMFGFPALSPIGYAKWANYSIEIAMLNQVIGMSFLFFFKSVNVFSICIVTFISEFISLIITKVSQVNKYQLACL